MFYSSRIVSLSPFINILIGLGVGVFVGWYAAVQYNTVAALDIGALIGAGIGLVVGIAWIIIYCVSAIVKSGWADLFPTLKFGGQFFILSFCCVFLGYFIGAIIGLPLSGIFTLIFSR